MIKNICNSILASIALAGSTRFDENAVIEDVRGGVQLTASYPPSLIEALGHNGQIAAKLGNFGHITYGSSMHVSYFYPSENRKGCLPFAKAFPQNSMVLVDAGACPVTTKVRNIEQAGGQVALIGDGFYENIEDVYMEDVDGSGFSLTIPALLIGKEAADTIKEQSEGGKDLRFVVDLEISKTDESIVEVGLWYGSTLDLDPTLLQGLYDY